MKKIRELHLISDPFNYFLIKKVIHHRSDQVTYFSWQTLLRYKLSLTQKYIVITHCNNFFKLRNISYKHLRTITASTSNEIITIILEIEMNSIDAFKHYQRAFSLSFLLNDKKDTQCSKLVAKEDSELKKDILSIPF